jgi:hypothetical protein
MESLPDIRNQLSQQGLFNAFKQQLAKDFQQSNCPFEFIEALQPDYENILQKITDVLRQNETTSDFNLMQLLNRADISETQLKRSLNEKSALPYHSVIAELIIKRVLQKVVVRQYFKNKGE